MYRLTQFLAKSQEAKKKKKKITGGFFVCEYRQDYSKVYMERQSRIAKTILKMKNKVGGIHLFRDKSYYTVIKTMWYW